MPKRPVSILPSHPRDINMAIAGTWRGRNMFAAG